MEALLGKVADLLFKVWHSPRACVGITTLCAVSLSHQITSGWTQWPHTAALIVSSVLVLAVPGVWLWQHRLPRASLQKVGVIVGITAERSEEELRVRNDFINALRKVLSGDQEASQFDVIVLPNYRAAELTDAGAALRVLRRVRGVFMIYGSVRWRDFKGTQVPFIDLEGTVRHRPIPDPTQRDFAIDFRRALPPRIVLAKGDSEVLGFAVTSTWIDVTVRYIVGRAAFHSGFVAYAETLLLSVEQRLRNSKQLPPHLREIARRLPRELVELYEPWLVHLAGLYNSSREPDALALGDEIAAKILSRDPGHYSALLMRSIAAFEPKRDIEASKRFLRACRRPTDGTWRYNLAFLLAYEGRMSEATAEYERAFTSPLRDVTVPLQSEEFIQAVLAEEPDKYQLHLCSGLINDQAKQDAGAALSDYLEFVARAKSEGTFAPQVAIAEAAIDRLQRGE